MHVLEVDTLVEVESRNLSMFGTQGSLADGVRAMPHIGALIRARAAFIPMIRSISVGVDSNAIQVGIWFSEHAKGS